MTPSWSEKYGVVILALLAWALVADAAEQTCRFVWNPVVTFTDGAPATGLASYRLYVASVTGGPYTLLLEVPVATLPDPTAPTAQAPCASQEFYVVQAYHAVPVQSSAFSAEFAIRALSSPANARIQEVTETSEELQIRTTRTVRFVE